MCNVVGTRSEHKTEKKQRELQYSEKAKLLLLPFVEFAVVNNKFSSSCAK